MDDEPGPPSTLIDHACQPGHIPPSGIGASERERLHAALTWSYECHFLIYDSWSAFTCSILFGTPESLVPVPQTRFEVTEDSLGIERTVLLSRTAGGVSMEAVELIPLASDGRTEVAFKLLEASPEQRCIRYSGDSGSPGYRYWKIRVGGLGVVRNPTAAVEVRTGGWEPVRFPAPVAARVEVADEFRIDRLSNAEEGRGPAQDQLAELFGLVCDGAAPGSLMLRVGCDYTHRLDGAGMEVTTPVFLSGPESQDSRELAEELAGMMRRWHEEVRPPDGEFVLRLQVYRRDAEEAQTLQVEFSRLLLAAASVSEL